MSDTLAVKTAASADETRRRARQLHEDAIVIDAATQLCYGYSDHLRDSGLTIMNSTVPMPDEDAGSAVERIAVCYEIIRHDPKLCLIEKAADIARAKAAGQVGVIIAFQDPYPLQYTMAMVEVFHRLGMRVLQLSYSGRSWAADGCGEDTDAGLSKDGKLLVGELNRVGVTVDLAHLGERSSFEAVELSGKPVICSHGNAKARSDIGRNLPDLLIKQIAAGGGVVCATPYAPLNWDLGDKRPSLAGFLDMLDYMVDLVGIDAIGIGTDEESTPGTMPMSFRSKLKWKAYFQNAYRGYSAKFKLTSSQGSLEGFRGLNDYPLITEGMAARGYDDASIRKVLGLNLIRVFEQTWK
jgi:membrane dipeptidase